jgi:hypothetical protein
MYAQMDWGQFRRRPVSIPVKPRKEPMTAGVWAPEAIDVRAWPWVMSGAIPRPCASMSYPAADHSRMTTGPADVGPKSLVCGGGDKATADWAGD